VPAYVNTFDMTTNTDTQTQLFHILAFISVRTEEEFKFELNRPHITGSWTGIWMSTTMLLNVNKFL